MVNQQNETCAHTIFSNSTMPLNDLYTPDFKNQKFKSLCQNMEV